MTNSATSPSGQISSQQSRAARFSLAEPPELFGCGAFGEDDPLMEWHQPRTRWHALLFVNPGQFMLNGSVTTFRKGGFFIVPPGSRCRVENTGPPQFVHTFGSFAPVDSGQDVYAIPLFTQFTPEECDVWDHCLRLALQRLPHSRGRNPAVYWNLLLRIAQPLHAIHVNPHVEVATAFIERNLGHRFSIAEVAHEADVSHNQLIRYFRQELGMTPIQYVRERRAEIARTMLTTTSKSVKQIALQVGVPDLHQFNRLIRDCLGMSPRQVRSERWDVDYYRTEAYREKV